MVNLYVLVLTKRRKTMVMIRDRRKEMNDSNVSVVDSAADLSGRLQGREISPGQFMALCPAHNDHNPSLAIKQSSDGSLLLHCFAGCDFSNIFTAVRKLGFSINNRKVIRTGIELPKGIITINKNQQYVAHWAYHNAAGEVIGYVVRFESEAGKKSFLLYFQTENGRWKAGFPTKDNLFRPLYNLHKIATASNEDEVWIAEGEKCVDALTELGVIATTSPNGANSAKKADWSPLYGRKIIIWPDNDRPGTEYAVNVFRQLLAGGESAPDVSVVDVERLELPPKGDVVDWIAKGNERRDILSIPRHPIETFLDLGVVEVDDAQIWKSVDQSEELLLKKDPHSIFQRCGMLFRVVTMRSKSIQASEEQSVGLKEISSAYFLDLLNRRLTFVELSPNGEFVAIDPPSKIVTRYMTRSGHWKLHTLTGIVYAPTLRSDGSVLEQPGYDEESGVYYDNVGNRFPPLEKNPTKEEALTALKRLRIPFQDFPFVAEEDESVVLAAILTTLIRQSLRTAPLFAFNAPVAASGKTLLANVISIIATGKRAVTAPQGIDREEERKHLFATLLQGKPIVLIDNVERPISSPILCNILTAPGMYKDRILGRSEMVEVPTNVTFLVTGNNLSFEGDITRRVLLCTIDPQCENPEARDGFEIDDLESYIIRFRARYIRAGLTILKAYVNAGKPIQDIPQYGGFEDWSDWVRSALVWLGCADPNVTRKKVEADDVSKINMSRIIALWRSIYGDEPVKVMEIVNAGNTAIERKDTTSKEYELAQVILEVTHGKGRLESDPIGKWLRRNKNKIRDGYKIVTNPDSANRNRMEWILVRA
jgi:putative DNA primase/helicase